MLRIGSKTSFSVPGNKDKIERAILILRTIVVLCVAAEFAHAASDRDLAEWAIRWEGRVKIEGQPRPIADMARLPDGDVRIVGIDLTGAVMHPKELIKLGTLTSLRELYLPGPIWNPGAGATRGGSRRCLQGSRDSEDGRKALLRMALQRADQCAC